MDLKLINDINKQLQFADIVQLVIARHLERDYGNAKVSVGLNDAWDIEFSGGITVEVKIDFAAATTQNAAIEFWCLRRNKPTGILSTKANTWLHCIPEGNGLRCYELSVDRLRRSVIEAGRVVNGGEQQASALKLIPVEKIKSLANSNFYLEDSIIKAFKSW